MRLLIVEDDPYTAGYLRKALTEAGYEVDHASNARDGLFMAATEPYAVLVIDRNLPAGADGISIVQSLRAQSIKTPVLILSQLAQLDDRVQGLRAGADDYLTKPYAIAELLARIEALIRRSSASTATTRLRVGDLEMDLIARTVTRGGVEIDLQPREFQLLEFLMRHAGQVVTRTMLLEGIWGYHFDPQTNVIDVHISRLRHKIDTDPHAPLLHTVRGAGYSLRADA
jgi:two-component system OmpR family response regulator